MESLKVFLKTLAGLVRPFLKTGLILVVAFLGIWLLFRICLETATWAAYSYFFGILTSQGGINAWLARAISALFAAAFFFGLSMFFSTNKQRRSKGRALLLGSFVAFNLLVYACTRSVVAVEEGQHFVGATGEARAWYYVTDAGDWELFPAPGYHPRTGESLKAMTPAAAREHEAWKRRNTEQSEEQEKSEVERRFRETYLNESLLPSSGPAGIVVVAAKTDRPGSQGDALQAHLVELLTEKGKQPLTGVFKPAFYDSLFDDLWNGDQSVLERLGLFDRTSARLLLGRATFSPAEKTDFEGLVSVQGTLSIIQLRKDGRTGPWTFTASAAGNNLVTATANCAKRLVKAIDFDLVFEK